MKYYYQYKKAIEEVISNAANFLFSWVRNFLVAFLVMQIAWVILAIFGLIYHFNYSNSWWYFFSFAIITYYIAIAGYSNAVETKIFFKTNFFSNQNQVLFLNNKEQFYLENISTNFQEIVIDETDQPLENIPDFTTIKLKIEDLLLTQKMYEIPELTLFDVAQKLGINISVLSKLVNQAFRVNFNDLVNSYRVATVVDYLQKDEHKKQTLLSIAFECGFNSKSTFNRAFKKEKGCSPKEFIKTHIS